MAKTLFEALQESQKAPPMNQLGGGQALQAGLQAKTGKALGSSSGPQASTLGEQAAAQDTAIQGQQLQKEQQLNLGGQQQQAQAQEENLGLQKQGIKEERADFQSKAARNATQLLNSFQREGKQLDYEKDKSKIEQLMSDARLSNEKYINDLQLNGDKARLGDELSFKQVLAKDVFGEQSQMLQQKFDWGKLLSKDESEFAMEMGKMSIADAIDALNASMKADAAKQMFTGIDGIVSTGASGYEKYSEAHPSTGPSEAPADRSRINSIAGGPPASQGPGNF